MISTRRPSAPRRVLAALIALVVLGVVMPGISHATTGPTATKLVRYRGWHARVPASWPVYRLGVGSHVCVRFDRHAVYLGRPGTAQHCPAHAAGRTEAILVQPRAAGAHANADTLGAGPAAAIPLGGRVDERVRPGQRVTVTATWSRHPAAVRSALGVASVTAAGAAWDRRAAAALHADALAARHHRSLAAVPNFTPTGPSTPGQVFTGLGFDACSAPSPAAMNAWASASPFQAVGVYIGGQNMACSQSNLTASWAATQAVAGWHLIPIYVGLQAPGNGCGCQSIVPAAAAAEGTTAAQNAVAEAQALGLGTGNPIYYDMENYTRTTVASGAVLGFLQAWTTQLHLAGYTSGVYSSELSGVVDLVGQQGTGYVEPDDLWIANWNGQQSTVDPEVPSTDWPNHQRVHQYRGGHTDDYGGASISIDSNYVDAATAAAGNGTVTTTIASAPTLSAKPEANGSIVLAPSWVGESGITSWRILGGTQSTALQSMVTVPSSQHTVLTHNGYGYFQVQALGANGVALGSSGTIVTQPHVAIFGHSAFVPAHGSGGMPVECFGITPCQVSTTIYDGHHLLVRTPAAPVAAGGGVVHFTLTARAHRLVARAGNRGLPVTVTVRTTTGRSAKSVMKLVPFSVSGAGPQRVPGVSPALKLIGATDFVSHGWTGGLLVACLQSTPCVATPALTVDGRPVATAAATTLGAGQVGYLPFRMTAAGHRRLMHASGNQLGVNVNVTIPGGGLVAPSTTTAAIALYSY